MNNECFNIIIKSIKQFGILKINIFQGKISHTNQSPFILLSHNKKDYRLVKRK
jgi:hypothetical protein